MTKLASDYPVDSTIQSLANKARKGTVLGNKLKDGDQVLAVEWDDGTVGKVNANDVEPSLSLEEEFTQFTIEVNEKIAQAAKLIREASDLAATKGLDLQSIDNQGDDPSYDQVFDSYSLESAMGSAGWNTSSWHC